MSTNYFDFLEQNSSDNPASSTPGNNNEGMVNLTTRADAECQVVCDGDFLFLLPPNQVIKEKAPVGQHLLQFISTVYPDVVVEKVVDFPEVGKNYLVMVSDFQVLLAERIKRAEAETIVTVEFTAKDGEKGSYTGHLKAGKPEGEGKVEFESGKVYQGLFTNGWRHGKGSTLYPNGDKHEGEWKEDVRSGQATYTWKNGDSYIGEFKDDLICGHGIYKWSNGNSFEGEFFENKKKNALEFLNKPNTYRWANGEKLVCSGWDGGSNGIGVKYSNDGSSQEELWEHGKRIKIGPSTKLVPIDLGLSVKWASMNFGSTAPECVGDLVYLGDETDEPSTQESFVFFGEKWRVPTSSEVQELIDKCQWTFQKYLNDRGVECAVFKVVSSINGNSIILPVGEVQCLSGEVIKTAYAGYYWTGDFAAGNDRRVLLYIKQSEKLNISIITDGLYCDGFARLVAK